MPQSASQHTERSIFMDALEIESIADRESFLSVACGDDSVLRASVDALLLAHELPANPLDAPVAAVLHPTDLKTSDLEASAEIASASESDIGRVIGAYRLMEQIGEGGFGLVYVAQQSEPVKRQVALKIIKPGTGSKEVLARFAAERQAVAMMDHPNIAQVFDAGVTEDGRPYFVMELVRGLPVNDFCEQNELKLRDRVALFADICAATHHAHQKGVIHRDLKPSNVLVTLHDTKPVAKVIDFGVAKAVGQSLVDQTIYTRFFSMIGTPLYMSPEQASLSGQDVDTRSDIYSLGVLLYELLTGVTPFERERFATVSFDEMRRIINEEDPPKPSVRQTTIREKKRRTHPDALLGQCPEVASRNRKLPRQAAIPSDLDWIVMKAMDKDRNRRYASAAAMATDLRRFLADEQVEACPPSAAYRLSKFTKRHRVTLLTAGLVSTSLIMGTVFSLYLASVAISERNDKEVALQKELLARREVEGFTERLKNANSLVEEARSYEQLGNYAAASAAYTEAIEQVPNYYLVWVQRASLRAMQRQWSDAARDFSEALQLDAPVSQREWQGVTALFAYTNRWDDFRILYARLAPKLGNAETRPSWHQIRSCLVAPRGEEDALQFAEWAEELLQSEGIPPPGGGPRREDEPGGRMRGAIWGGVWSGPAAPRSGGPVPPHGGGPHDIRRPPEGGREGWLPRGVQHYVVAWAWLRADQPEKALRHIELASADRGWKNQEMLFALRAQALWRQGHYEESRSMLEKSEAVIIGSLDRYLATADRRAPWFDLVEAILLHREVLVLANGTADAFDQQLQSGIAE